MDVTSGRPRFSIVIAAYNVGRYIEQCLDSLLRQSFRDWEAVVVDDSSTDNTAILADELSRKDSRIHVVHKQQNEGRHLARKTGVEQACGKWIFFLDGDDELSPDALSVMLPDCEDSDDIDLLRYGLKVVPENPEAVSEAKALEIGYNSGSGTLRGDDKLRFSFSETNGVKTNWTTVAIAIRAQECKTAFSRMTNQRLQRLEDAYEYFVIADCVRSIAFHVDKQVLQYHWGRGITGVRYVSLRTFRQETQEMKQVAEAVEGYAAQFPSDAVKNAAEWLCHEIPKHVSTEMMLRVDPNDLRTAIVSFARIWGYDVAQAEAYRLVSDRAQTLLRVGIVPDTSDELHRSLRLIHLLDLFKVYSGKTLQDSVYLVEQRKIAEKNIDNLRRKMSSELNANKGTQALSAFEENVSGVDGKRRLAIFCFYDPMGHAATYIKPFLDDLQRNVTDLVIVSNGKLDEPTKQLFASYTDDVLERENKGLDVAAYRLAIQTFGWQKLESYDEIICLNDTIMGPVYPFSEMFAEMDNRQVDFWGITAYAGETVNNEVIPTHLQAYWHAYRKSLVSSEAFHEYWDNMPIWSDYAEVTRKHEMAFTKHFEDLGFKWDSYVDWRKYQGISSYPLLYMPTQLIREDRCPVFKRRSFFVDYGAYFDQTAGQPAMDLYDYLRSSTIYDMNLVWDALLQSYNVADIRKAMHLDYVLPYQARNPRENDKPKSAFIFHVFFMDLLNDTCHYLANIPIDTDLYITTTEDKIDQIKQGLLDAGIRRDVTFIPVQNRGRDVSALLVGAKDVVLGGKYEVIGFAHDKKSSQNQENGHHGTETQGFTYKLMENTLGSPEYVENVLTLFADNPRLGIASPMPPYHALYFAHTLPADWGPNFNITKDLLENKLDIHVPLDSAKPTMSAMGSCYWFRADALKKLFEVGWQYEDFLPEGEMGVDGTISHAIERANGYVAQGAGYYPAWIMSDRYARIEVDSLLYSTNLMLGALGPFRKGETLQANCNSLAESLSKTKMMEIKARRYARKGLSATAHALTAHMSEKNKEKFYNTGWHVVSKLLGRI